MSPKPIPKNLGPKIRSIREWKGLTMDEMADLLGKKDVSRRSRVHEWEKGIRMPDYLAILAYASIANITVEVLLNDSLELDLPPK